MSWVNASNKLYTDPHLRVEALRAAVAAHDAALDTITSELERLKGENEKIRGALTTQTQVTQEVRAERDAAEAELRTTLSRLQRIEQTAKRALVWCPSCGNQEYIVDGPKEQTRQFCPVCRDLRDSLHTEEGEG